MPTSDATSPGRAIFGHAADGLATLDAQEPVPLGQLAWNRYYQPVDPTGGPGGGHLAVARRDEVVGFGWAESPDWLELQVDPDRPEVADDVVDWFEDWSDAPQQSAVTMEGDGVEPVLPRGRIRVPDDAWRFTHHLLDLRELPPVPRLTGYRLRPSSRTRPRPGRHPPGRVVGLRAVSRHCGGLRAGHARPALSQRPRLGGVDLRGEMVASALVWLDEAIGVALVEPVGCAPAHRGRGLAGAVTLAALHARTSSGRHRTGEPTR